MSQVILHHYQLSPYSEKTRLAMGLKKVAWNSVDIPIWTPRPKLTPMTGGYRRTPIAQVGAEFYCDSLHIFQLLEQLGGAGRLYPPGQKSLAKAIGWWFEKSSFFNAVSVAMGGMEGVPQELIDERLPLFGVNIDPEVLRPERAKYLQRVDAHLQWIDDLLSDGRNFLLGAEPSAADLSVYHPLWFVRQNGGDEVNELVNRSTAIDVWYERVAAIGHGDFIELTADQAIDAARESDPSEPDEWSREAERVGLHRGDKITVTPDDYGNPVYGTLIAWAENRVVLRHEDPSVGKVNLHFPRVGFDVALAA